MWVKKNCIKVSVVILAFVMLVIFTKLAKLLELLFIVSNKFNVN